LDINQLSLGPEADFSNFIIEGVNTKVDLFLGIGVDFEL